MSSLCPFFLAAHLEIGNLESWWQVRVVHGVASFVFKFTVIIGQFHVKTTDRDEPSWSACPSGGCPL